MRATRASRHYVGGDMPDLRMPVDVEGWTYDGSAEVYTDDGKHQAFGVVLASPEGGWKLVLWWQREPSRRWVLTPLSE